MPQRLADAAAASNATRTYLGRLLPLSRAIRLADDCRSLVLANGLDYPPYSESGWREPSATLVVRQVKGEQKRVLLQLSLGRSIWRELHALTVKGASASGLGGPAALQNVSDEEAFDLWAGTLLADQAKLVDAVESVFHIPAAMLTETSQQIYEHGVRQAERAAWRLERAVTKYHIELGDNLDPPQMKSRRQQIQGNASASFWTDIENAVPRLLEVAAAPENLGLKAEWHKTVWGQSVWRGARAAYEHACPHETPRQIRAYALGLRTLLPAPAEHGEADTPKEAEA
jgi:CRISPR system Cascade subunit CasA